MARHKVEISGVNTASIKVLSSNEMIKLFQAMANGNQLARNQLIEGNLRLVLSILKSFNNKVDNMDDLFQVGCIGLVKAIDNFDLKYNVKFSTYAVPMITGEVKRYLRDGNSLRISRSVKDIAYKAIRLKEELTSSNGLVPTDQEIATILGITEFEVANAMQALKEPVSMYEPIYNDGGDTIYLFDQIADKSTTEAVDKKIALNKALDKLKPRERRIVELRYIIGLTQMEIANELGISQAQISRIEKNAVNNIKKLVL